MKLDNNTHFSCLNLPLGHDGAGLVHFKITLLGERHQGNAKPNMTGVVSSILSACRPPALHSCSFLLLSERRSAACGYIKVTPLCGLPQKSSMQARAIMNTGKAIQ